MKLIKKNNKKGFTLVELIVVIAILAILALILVPAITGYVEKANKSKDYANARALYSEAVIQYSEEGKVDNEKISNMANQFENGASATVTENDGEIVVTYTNKSNKSIEFPGDGEYIEFPGDGEYEKD